MRTNLPKRTLACLLLAILTLGGAALLAAGKNDTDRAREIWMAGYLKFEEANKAEGENKLMLALDLYREALAAFTEVKSKFPTWNPSLLDYRTNFCKERCRRLEASVSAKSVDLSKTDLVSLSKTQEAKIKAMAQENLDLKRKVDLTAKSLEQARSEAARKAASDTDLDKLVRENKALQDAQGAAAERERQLRADLEALKSQSGVKKKAEELQQKLDVALAQQAKLEQEAESYQNAVRSLKGQLKDAVAARDLSAEDVRQLKAVAAQDKELADQRETRLKETETQLTAANQALAELRLKCGTLETQAGSAAEQTKKFQDEVASLRPFRDQLLKTTGENQELTAKLTVQTGELTAAKQEAAKVAVLQEQVARLTQEAATIPGLQEQVNQSRQEAGKIPALQEQLARLKQEAATIPGLQEQVNQLRQEAAKVAPLQEQVRRLQLETERLTPLEKELLTARPDAAKLKDALTDLTAARAETATATRAVGELREQLRGLSAELAKSKEDATATAQDRIRLDARVKEWEQRAAAAEKQATETGAQRDALKARLLAGEEELNELRPLREKVRTGDMEKQAVTAKLTSQSEELTAARRQVTQLEGQIKDRETRIQALEAAAKGSQAERDDAQAKRLRETEARIAALEKQVQENDNASADLRAQLAAAKNRADAAQTQTQPLVEELAALRPLRDRVRQVEAEKQELTGKLTTQTQELTALRPLRDQLRLAEVDKQELAALRPLRDQLAQEKTDKQALADRLAAQTQELATYKRAATQSTTVAAERERRVKELEQAAARAEAGLTERDRRVRELEQAVGRLEAAAKEAAKPVALVAPPVAAAVPVEESEPYRILLAKATTLERQVNETRAKTDDVGRRADAAVRQAEKWQQTATALEQEKTLKEQALQAARNRLAELGKIEELLKVREGELTEVQEKNTAAALELNRRELLVATATQRVTELERQTERTTQMLDALQTRNKVLTEELNGLKQDRGQRNQTVVGLEEKLAAAEKARADLELTRNDLLKRHDAALALGRRQEERLTELEKSMAAHKLSLTEKDGRLAETARALQELKDKAAVFDGLKSSLNESEAAQAAAQTRLKTLEKQVTLLEVQTREKEQESKLLRQALDKERLSKTPENSPLLEQLRTLNRELDQEKEKTKAIEQTLASYQAQVQATPAARATGAAGSKEQPDSDRVILARGFLQMATGAEKQGRKEAAVWNYKKALEYQPDNKLAFKRLGILASQDGNEEDAEGYLKRAFYADPDDVDILLPLGFSLVRQGKADLAVSMLARAAALRPEDANIQRTYGVACSSLGWTDAAEAQLRRALELNPKDGEAAFNLAILLVSRKPPQTEEGRSWYRKARALGVAADPGLERLFAQP